MYSMHQLWLRFDLPTYPPHLENTLRTRPSISTCSSRSMVSHCRLYPTVSSPYMALSLFLSSFCRSRPHLPHHRSLSWGRSVRKCQSLYGYLRACQDRQRFLSQSQDSSCALGMRGRWASGSYAQGIQDGSTRVLCVEGVWMDWISGIEAGYGAVSFVGVPKTRFVRFGRVPLWCMWNIIIQDTEKTHTPSRGWRWICRLVRNYNCPW